MNMIQLEQQLASNRHMIEQLERELQLKNAMIAEIEFNGCSAPCCFGKTTSV
jgi:predicted RNase H-like nuclease (RuvC/YqgF family)